MPGPVQAVERALTVLEVFASDPRPLSIDEVAAKAGLPRATAHRLIRTLQSRHYLQATGKKFRLGHSVLGLGFGRLNAAGLNRSAQPVLDALTIQTNETSILAMARPTPRETNQSSGLTTRQPAISNRPQATNEVNAGTTASEVDPTTFIVTAVANPHQTLTVAIQQGQELDPGSALIAPLRLPLQVDTEWSPTPLVGFYDQARSVRVVALEVRPWTIRSRTTLAIASPASRWTPAQLLDRYAEALTTHARLLGG